MFVCKFKGHLTTFSLENVAQKVQSLIGRAVDQDSGLHTQILACVTEHDTVSRMEEFDK